MTPRTHLEFRTSAKLDRGTNERRGGREVIATLAEGLPPLGIVVCEPVEEDWGWCLFATTNGVRPMVGCGPYEEYDDGWLVFVEPPRGLRAWFKRDSITAATTKIAAAMRDVIAGDGRFHHLRWWTDPAGLGPTEPADGHDR